MAMISYANTYPGLTKAVEGATEQGEPDTYYPSGKRNYMRTVPADDIQGVAGANWAYETKGARKAYILDDQSLYGHGSPWSSTSPSPSWAAKSSAPRGTIRRRPITSR